jgi:hypothetical protein
MDHLPRLLILLMVAGAPAAAPPASLPPSDLCLDAGSLIYRISPTASPAELRVKIDPHAPHPDLQVQLVDDVAAADFALVDDASAGQAAGCAQSSAKVVRIVTDTGPADLTVALSSAPAAVALRLYVHSARFGSHEAAALYAAMRHFEHPAITSGTQAENHDASW